MKRLVYLLISIIGVSVLIGTGVSCKKEMFDAAIYDTLVKIKSPVDSVDPNHKWELTTSKYIIVTANAGTGTRQVQIFDDNPMFSESAQIIAQLDMAEGDRIGLSISYPNILTTLYAAAKDSLGTYTLTKFNPNDRDVDFSNPIVSGHTLTNTFRPQYYAFCFEQEFPEPGDYDYNDVVMHIALERANPREMYFHVRLAAVGGDQQLAGCLRLPDFKYEEIDTAYTIGNQTFNKDIPDQVMVVQQEHDLLLKGLKDEPILNLFADAHWATGDIMNENYGMFKRKQYNVTKTSSTDAQLIVPREITFVLKFKTDIRANGITLDNIDPFVLHQYNGAKMEIHTYNYRHVKALHEYNYTDVDNLPWALLIPYSSFCHPLHGVNMGFRMKDSSSSILFGAYSQQGHSFGEWSMNRNKCLDWYMPQYATKTQVFIW